MKNEAHINELMQELSECREDERNTANQILSVIAAAGTILGVILTAGIFSSNGEDGVELGSFALTQDELMRCVFILSNLVFCTACAYAVTLGISAVLRYHYARKLEDQLFQLIAARGKDASPGFVHWMSFSGAFVTRNVKHVKGVNGWLYFIGYTIAATGVVVFCVAMMLIEFALIKNPTWVDKALLAIPIITTIVTLVAFWFASMCSGEDTASYVGLAKKRRAERIGRKLPDRWLTPQLVAYLIYPKMRDLQKPGLIVMGYMLHTLLRWNPVGYDFLIWDWKEYIALLLDKAPALLWLVFMFDFLAYQMRYQINDLRGLKQDVSEKKSPIPGIQETKNARKIVRASLVVIFIRMIVLAGALLVYWKTDPQATACFAAILAALWAGTIGYEFFRSQKENGKLLEPHITTLMIFLFVGIGYPLRFLVGAVAAGYIYNWGMFWPCWLVFELYGIYAAVLPWKRQIIESGGEKRNFSKLHYNVMANAEKNRGVWSAVIKRTDILSFALAMMICLLKMYASYITKNVLLIYYSVVAAFSLITFLILQVFIPRPCKMIENLKKVIKDRILLCVLGKDTIEMLEGENEK